MVASGVGVSVGAGVGDGAGSVVSVGEGFACGVFVAVGGRDVEVSVGDEITATTVGVERAGSGVPEGSKPCGVWLEGIQKARNKKSNRSRMATINLKRS
jgi:hypothetical protein